ncbi:hypothetical protein N9M21_06955, partial [Alphaproteobacteria bacterium]|nr:hypothetical protein [Alphaproteobacteria bacterium]
MTAGLLRECVTFFPLPRERIAKGVVVTTNASTLLEVLFVVTVLDAIEDPNVLLSRSGFAFLSNPLNETRQRFELSF